MGFFLHYTLLVAIASYCHSYPCSGSSCSYSCSGQSCDIEYSCNRRCENTYSCRGSYCRDSHSCCVPFSCNRFRTCDRECCESRSCCESSCCNCPCPAPTPTPTTTQRTAPPDTYRPPPLPPPTRPPIPFIYPPSSNRSDSTINLSNHSVVIPTNITIQNDINSVTRITVPVNITVSNVNNIQISPALSGNTTTKEKIKERECNATTTTTVVTVNQTIPVPYPVPVPVPYVIKIPYTQPVSSGCCQTVQPCVPYHYCGCQTSQMHCSNQCVQQYMYQPINVCQMGCYKKDFAFGHQCYHGGCYQGQVDCSSCHSNFYHTYDSFLRCSGCFVPMHWG